MSGCCDNSEAPVKRLDVTVPAFDHWRSNVGSTLPDGVNDHTEEISHNGPIVVGALAATANKIATFVGDIDVQGEIDPNSIVFSDAPAGVASAFNSIAAGYYRISVIGNQRTIVLMPKNDVVDAVQVRAADGTTVVFDVDTLNKRVGVNTANPQAALDVNGDVIFDSIVNLANFTANAAIGTAANTVDKTSVVTINQTTAGISVTLPTPARTKSGRLLFVVNLGTQAITVDGNSIPAGRYLLFIWNNPIWYAPAGGSGGTTTAEDFFRSGTAAALVKPDGTNDFTEKISHNGDLGLGLADPSVVSARLDVSGAAILRTVALGNFAANGAIGTAPLTVDIASTITINQTTGLIVLTIPNPTNTQPGRVLNIANIGTAQVKVGNQHITPKTAQSYIFASAALGWIPLGDNPDAVVVGASRNLQPSDHLKTLLTTAAVTLTCPVNIGYLLCRVRQQNAGAATLAAGAGVTRVAPFGAATAGVAGCSVVVEVINNVMYVE